MGGAAGSKPVRVVGFKDGERFTAAEGVKASLRLPNDAATVCFVVFFCVFCCVRAQKKQFPSIC